MTKTMIDDPRLRRHPLGFLQVAVPPSPEELRTYYADLYFQSEKSSYRKSYSVDEMSWIRMKISQKASMVDTIRQVAEPGTLLDVGCGEGFVLSWFRDSGWTVKGIDHSVAGLQSMNPDLLPNVDVGDLFAILDRHIAGAVRYDVVWLSNVLEHVVDPVVLLQSLRKLINPKGVLVVTVPNDGSAYQESLLAKGDIPERFWIAIPDHLAYFSCESLKRTAEATGWAAREIVADFPIDWFLAHTGSNYVQERSNGPAAHQARIRLDLMLGDNPSDDVNAFYRALAHLGFGRNLTAFLTPSDRGGEKT
ncbi:MAG TPA: class I SAM-dependent methyltransferase [Burkholderiales bacterium]|nr:class I SAM-dependent methyltransferase [Burkholderiales bacterium]